MVMDLVIIGAGGFGREASLLVEEINAASSNRVWRLLGFIDSDEAKWGLTLRGYPVIGYLKPLQQLDRDVQVICAIGDPWIKRKVVAQTAQLERKFATLVHPQVNLAADVAVGEGVLINKGCLFTVETKIGDHVSINPGSGVGHDAIIGEYSTLMWRVNISGNTVIGSGCLLGSGSTVLQGLRIGEDTTVGAGAVVTEDLPADCTAVGVPARVIKRRS